MWTCLSYNYTQSKIDKNAKKKSYVTEMFNLIKKYMARSHIHKESGELSKNFEIIANKDV